MAQEEKETAIAKREPTGGLEPAPSYIHQGREGLEDMSKQDVLIPRLALAQALSPQVTDGDPNRIPGLAPGMLFNSMTGEIYGSEVVVQVLRKDRPRAMEWKPIEQGGGIIDPDVPLNDPRLKWGPNGEKPQAMLYRDYIARIPATGDIIALSFKSSGIKVAKALNGFITYRNKPIYTGLYRITTGTELKPKPHKVYKVENAGWVTEDDQAIGKQMHDAVKDLDATKIDREDRPGDDDFDPEELERQTAASNARAVGGM